MTGRGELTPTGISGDLDTSPTQHHPRETRQVLGKLAELIDRYDDGRLTPDEERELLERLSAEVAQGYN